MIVTIKKLAERLSLSETSVRKIVLRLEADGKVTSEKRLVDGCRKWLINISGTLLDRLDHGWRPASGVTMKMIYQKLLGIEKLCKKIR